jgi:shikimate kinase
MHKHVLVIGMPGTGKTTLTAYFIKKGKTAFDGDEELGKWLDKRGHVKRMMKHASKKWLSEHRWRWNVRKLKKLLKDNRELYLFGGADNQFDVLDLFDRTYYLKADKKLLAKRLKTRTGPYDFGKTKHQKELVFGWINSVDRRAKENGLIFIDASLSPNQIFRIITKK